MYDSCMSKTITIDDDVYELLKSLKQGPGDSFTKVLRRNVHKHIELCGELLDSYEQNPPSHKADLKVLKRIELERGRPSGGRK
jgi:predicted CopG family antitoxin